MKEKQAVPSDHDRDNMKNTTKSYIMVPNSQPTYMYEVMINAHKEIKEYYNINRFF